MVPFKVVAVAASAGGLEPLEQLVSGLPRGFPAAVLVVLHSGSGTGSAIPEILNGVGRLPAHLAADGERLSPGRIYVAPGDRHMIVEGDKIRLVQGPKEHFVRPAADPTFRSLAREFGRRAIGIVLSGSGRDGAEGLAAIKAAGGTTIVQDPKDAPFPSMPLSALAVRLPDHCLAMRNMTALIQHLVRAEGAGTVAPRASLRGLSVLMAAAGPCEGAGLRGMLDRLGCRVVGPASTRGEAIELVRREGDELDCAVVDVDLAGGSAYPLAAALRAYGVPLVFVTEAETRIAERWRWVPRIAVPCDDAELQAVLQATLDGSKAPLPSSLGAAAVSPRSGIRYAWETAEESLAHRLAAKLAAAERD